MCLFHIVDLFVGKSQSFFLTITKGEHNTWFLVKGGNTTHWLILTRVKLDWAQESCWFSELHRGNGWFAPTDHTGSKQINTFAHNKSQVPQCPMPSGELTATLHQTKTHDTDGTEEGNRKCDATWIGFIVRPHTVTGRQPTLKQHVVT